MLQNYAKYVIHQDTSTDTKVNSIVIENFSELSEILKKYSTGDGVVQVQQLLQDVMSQIKSMIDILKGHGN